MQLQYGSSEGKVSYTDLALARGISRVVLILMAVNAGIFVFLSLAGRFGMLDVGSVVRFFGEVSADITGRGRVWQLLTSMFLHGDLGHLLSNMIFLWCFGTLLEREWGGRQFLLFYLVCGLGANVVTLFIRWGSTIPSIGASGAIFGLLGACAMVFRHRKIIFFLIVMPLRYFCLGAAAIELFLCIMSPPDGIAHWSHVAGFLIGPAYLKFTWRRQDRQAVATPKPTRFENVEID